jgi:hypothetical protein
VKAHPAEVKEYARRDYRKHRRRRVKRMLRYYYRDICAHPKMYAVYLEKRRKQHARRMKNPAYAKRRREQQRRWERTRVRIR